MTAIVDERVLDLNKVGGKMTCDLDCCPGRQKTLGMGFLISLPSDVQAFNPIVLVYCIIQELPFEVESRTLSLFLITY